MNEQEKEQTIHREARELAMHCMEAYLVTCQATGLTPIKGVDALIGVLAATIVRRDVDVIEAVARRLHGGMQ